MLQAAMEAGYSTKGGGGGSGRQLQYEVQETAEMARRQSQQSSGKADPGREQLQHGVQETVEIARWQSQRLSGKADPGRTATRVRRYTDGDGATAGVHRRR